MVYELLLYSTLCSWFRLLPEDRCILTPKSKPKNWYERLDEDTKAIVLGIGFIIFVLLLVFVLSNPVLAVTILAVFGLAIFTIYAKYKTGHWWWKTYGPQPTSTAAPSNPPQVQSEPMMVERETTTKEVFVRRCSHCGAKVSGTRINCPNCGAIL